jgi:folate-binding protein YgfZ
VSVPDPLEQRVRVTHPSPLLSIPGAVASPADGSDHGIAWHYGDPMGEQRAAETSAALLDGWNDEHLAVSGPDRLTWLHTLSTQHLSELPDRTATQALWLSPQGHVEHEADLVEIGGVVALRTDRAAGEPLLRFLASMVFWSKVEVADRTEVYARLTVVGPRARAVVQATVGADLPPAGRAVPLPPASIDDDASVATGFARVNNSTIDLVVDRRRIPDLTRSLAAHGAVPAGSWAAAALRIPARRPRFGLDIDERTIPNELPWLQSAVHLNKGCYRGQETVARVSNLGLPPRRLVLLHLDGSADTLPSPGDAVLTSQGRAVGRVGTVAQHWEDGPIALALVKRSIQPGTALLAGGVDASIDPDDAVDESLRPASIDRSALPDLRRR